MEDETALDPARPIVDPHHHLWDPGAIPGLPPIPPFFVPEMAETIRASGHTITHTVFLECRSMYRQNGPEELKPVGETEFVSGQAAMSESGRYGPSHIAAGIVGAADLRLGSRVVRVLQAHMAAGGGRFRGIRVSTAYSDKGLFGFPADPEAKELMLDSGFRDGARMIGAMGLTLDIWCLHPQLADLLALAKACPNTTIILVHLGTPADRTQEAFREWREGITALAALPNVLAKIGGLGMDLYGAFGTVSPRKPSDVLAADWRPYVETCIDTFTADRCMFSSNFPPDGAIASYGALWNAFKIITRDASEDEKDKLFRGTAAATYRLPMS